MYKYHRFINIFEEQITRFGIIIYHLNLFGVLYLHPQTFPLQEHLDPVRYILVTPCDADSHLLKIKVANFVLNISFTHKGCNFLDKASRKGSAATTIYKPISGLFHLHGYWSFHLALC